MPIHVTAPEHRTGMADGQLVSVHLKLMTAALMMVMVVGVGLFLSIRYIPCSAACGERKHCQIYTLLCFILAPPSRPGGCGCYGRSARQREQHGSYVLAMAALHKLLQMSPHTLALATAAAVHRSLHDTGASGGSGGSR